MRAATCAAALAAALIAFPSAGDMPPSSSNSDRAGAAVEYVYLCGDCHGAIGEGRRSQGVPPLAGRSAQELKQRLAQLSTGAAGSPWPGHAQLLRQLHPEDIDAISDYLASLVPPPAIATE
jgi:cytochrome c553